MARLKEIYRNEIAPKLKEELKLSNVMEVPRVTKTVSYTHLTLPTIYSV
mgnify:CR=1 FL=1